MLQIKASVNEIGMAIEASQDDGKTWVTVQLTPFRIRKQGSPAWGKDGIRPYSTWISPADDIEEYFAEIDARGIKYKRVGKLSGTKANG